MIEELNETVWCKLSPSPIHGIGVFAIRNIPKGQKLYCRGMPNSRFLRLRSLEGIQPEIKELILQRWPIAAQGKPFQSPNDDARLISFMNHSSKPNYDQFTDRAVRDIAAGEEITEDYELCTG